MIKVGLVGLGKMGLSHLSIFNAHSGRGGGRRLRLHRLPARRARQVHRAAHLHGLRQDARRGRSLDAVVIATPSHLHAPMVRDGARGRHPRLLREAVLPRPRRGEDLARAGRRAAASSPRSATTTATSAPSRGQAAARRRRDRHGHPHPRRGLRPGRRSSRRAHLAQPAQRRGGGSLYDYAAHPLNLVNWYLGEPAGRSAAPSSSSIFSRETDDEVSSTLSYADDAPPSSRQLVATSRSARCRPRSRMWGTHGRIYADRQEVQVYLRDPAPVPEGYEDGWNVKYTTELTDAVGSTSAARSTAPRSTTSSAGSTTVTSRVCNDLRVRRRDRPGHRRDRRGRRPAPRGRRRGTRRRHRAAPATDVGPTPSPRHAAPSAGSGPLASAVRAARRAAHDRGQHDHDDDRSGPVAHGPPAASATTSSSASTTCPRRRRAPSRCASRTSTPCMSVLDAAYDEGVTHLHVHHPRPDRRDLRRGARQPGPLPRHGLLPVHAVRAQVRERHDRGRLPRSDQALPARRRPPRRCHAGHEVAGGARTSRASPPCSSTPR